MSAAPEDGRKRSWEHAPDTYGLVEDISDALVSREQNQFLLTDADGDIPPDNLLGYGFYADDTRHLSTYSLLLNGEPPLVLASTGESGFSQEQVLGNHRGILGDQVVGRGTIELVRWRHLGKNLVERLEITNHNQFEVDITVTYRFEADFKDIFEVRGHTREHPGEKKAPEVTGEALQYDYLGADKRLRQTMVCFESPPAHLEPGTAVYEVHLGPRQSRTLRLEVRTSPSPDGPRDVSFEALRKDYGGWRQSFGDIYTDNEHFNEILHRSINDLRTLWTRNDQGGYFAAGVPWYSTLFGRDSIIAALQVLPLRPDLASECLRILAHTQSHAFDKFREQEPGKILHELRISELNQVGELPYSLYYGSVDSTPLFLLLAAAYFRWTADVKTIAELRPAIREAITWVREHGRHHPDPYLRYSTASVTGLRNQGWKDSADSIMHTDGSLCDGPIALVEVQSYLYAVYRELPPLLRALGDNGLADDLAAEAEPLRRRFEGDFWLASERRLAIALDGDNRPAGVVSSNAGQALWGGIVNRDHAGAVRDCLFQSDMFSGWGIRTLSSETQGYFPLGYHLGTIWPHDNAIIAAGLKRYGYDIEVIEVLTALADAAQRFKSRRLPELYGGHPRTPHLPPVPYPVACRPQAWAAGSIVHVLLTSLGLSADASNRKLYVVRPRLPYWLNHVQIQALRVGDETVDLRFERIGGETRLHAEPSPGLEIILSDNPEQLVIT